MSTAMLAPVLVWELFDPKAAGVSGRVRRRLARVRPQPAPGQDALALSAGALGVAAPPAAAMARLAEGLAIAGEVWFRAEPVMLIADRDRLVMQRLGEDPLSEGEAQALIEAANAHFDDGSLYVERSCNGRWYARAPALEPAPGISPPRAEGPEVTPAFAHYGSAHVRLLNELQMLWHAHPVNRARHDAGRVQSNALWLWGGGTLPEVPRRELERPVLATSMEMRGFADWMGLRQSRLEAPTSADLKSAPLVVIAADEAEMGAEWLDALARRRGGFRLLCADRDWQVPRRRLPRW